MNKIHMASFAVEYAMSAKTVLTQLKERTSFFFSLSILVMTCSGLMTTCINNSVQFQHAFKTDYENDYTNQLSRVRNIYVPTGNRFYKLEPTYNFSPNLIHGECTQERRLG